MPFVPIFGTGFEYGNKPVNPNWFSTNCVVQSAGGPHTGSYHLAERPVGAAYFTVYIPDTADEIDVGFWIKPREGIFGSEVRAYLSDGNYLMVKYNDDFKWDAYVNEVWKASGIIVTTKQVYQNIQVRFIAADSGYIYTQIEGNADIVYSGDTKPGSSVTFEKITIQNKNSYLDGLDDIVIGTGGWPGDIRFDGLVPDGDTATQEWMKTGFSLSAAPDAPTVATGAGDGLTGDYYYKVTFVDTDGETAASSASALVQPSNQSVDLSNIDIGPDGTTARKIYRTEAGGSTYKLVTTINDNTTTTYNDTVADGALGATLPVNSPHYTEIDEKPGSTTDYIWTETDEAQDLFTLQDWDATKKIPIMVTHWVYCKKITADSQQIKLLLKSGATLKKSDALNAYTSDSHVFVMDLLDPDGNPWTDDVIDNMDIGVELVGAS